MENHQNETTQNTNLQNGTLQNIGNTNSKRSWIRRHPIATIILSPIIFCIVFVIISGFIGTVKNNNIKNECLKNHNAAACNEFCSTHNLELCYIGCFEAEGKGSLGPDHIATCEYLCRLKDFGEEELVNQYNNSAPPNRSINISHACIAAKEDRKKLEDYYKQKEEQEQQEQFKRSPRGRCESTCNSMYTQGTETWQLCMTSCEDMKSN